MPLQVTLFPKSQTTGISDTITSNALSGVIQGTQIEVVVEFGDNGDVTAQTISNNNTSVPWGAPIQTTNTASNCKVLHWKGTVPAGTVLTTISVQATAGSNVTCAKALYVFVANGAHATDPIPAGNLFLIASGINRTQSITPTSPGSYLVMVLADWQAIDPASGGMAAGTGCVLAVPDEFQSGQLTGAVIYPLIQPRTDIAAFVLREADGGSTKCIGVAFEIQAAPPTGVAPGEDDGDSFQFTQAA